MKRALRLSATFILLAVSFAGCVSLGDAPTDAPTHVNNATLDLPDPVTILTDPEGDATERNSQWAQHAIPCASIRDAPEEGEEAPNACTDVRPVVAGDDEEPTGGVPAPAARDALEVRFQETPTACASKRPPPR